MDESHNTTPIANKVSHPTTNKTECNSIAKPNDTASGSVPVAAQAWQRGMAAYLDSDVLFEQLTRDLQGHLQEQLQAMGHQITLYEHDTFMRRAEDKFEAFANLLEKSLRNAISDLDGEMLTYAKMLNRMKEIKLAN